MPQVEAWRKVFMSDAEFMESTHGKIGCTLCHGGNSSSGYSSIEDKDFAHTGLVADPSDISCSGCHYEIACVNEDSLHTTLSGMKYALETRGGNLEEGSSLAIAFENHCAECHTSCGQCHVSIPDQSGGGFVYNHEFLGTPTMSYNCTACHGSRVGDEYTGGNVVCPDDECYGEIYEYFCGIFDGDITIAADLHYEAGMKCSSCHTSELHGSTEAVGTRYDNTDTIACVDCHEEVLTDAIEQHQQHVAQHVYHQDGDTSLSCQVCHSITYKNCYSCHVALDDNDLPYRTSETEMGFKIGRNPLKSEHRPYDYVVLRHAPVSIDTFVYYGEGLLPDFDDLSTWKYATPHNIQLATPQNESCNACHGHDELFLRDEDVIDDEEAANQLVMVEKAPDPVS